MSAERAAADPVACIFALDVVAAHDLAGHRAYKAGETAAAAELFAHLIADATLAMFCKYAGSLFAKAGNRDDRRFQATRRDVARTIAALKAARDAGEEGVAAVGREVGMARLADALPAIDAAAGVAEPETRVPPASTRTSGAPHRAVPCPESRVRYILCAIRLAEARHEGAGPA